LSGHFGIALNVNVRMRKKNTMTQTLFVQILILSIIGKLECSMI